MKSTEAAGALLAEVEEPPAVEALKSIPVAPSATVVPPPLVVPAPPPPEMTSVEAADPLLAEVEEPPAAEALKPLTPARETTPVPSVTIKEPAPKAATPTSKWPTKGETKAQVPPPPPKKSAKKFQPTVAKAPPAETDAKEKKASTEPVTKAAPADLEAVTVLSEKIVAPASSASPSKVTVLPAPIISKPSVVQNVVPWVTRNIRPIGIGIAALFAVSLAYGFIQKKRSPSLTKPSQETSVTQQRQEPAAEPAKDVVPAPVAATNNAEQDKIDADRLLAERTAREEKAADEAKLAAQKAADDAKLLAEQQKVNQPDQTKPAPGLETAANTNTQEAPKTRGTQKQTQKDSQSSGRSRTNTNSQSANRQAPAAPVTRPPPAQRPANNPQRSRSEFGATAPGG